MIFISNDPILASKKINWMVLIGTLMVSTIYCVREKKEELYCSRQTVFSILGQESFVFSGY